MLTKEQRTIVTRANSGLLLVSYSYFEKDEVQAGNFAFFLAVGMGVRSSYAAPPSTRFVIVQNGPKCSPCSAFDRSLHFEAEVTDSLTPLLDSAFSAGPELTFLRRSENEGMDIAAHNVTIAYLRKRKQTRLYKYFLFLNSSVRGPFYPSWVPAHWHWPDAFLDRLTSQVKAVAASLTCLPAVDVGGPGPRLESWAFATDNVGLSLLVQEGVFERRTCKHCTDGIIVHGEYGLSRVMFKHNYNIATLLSMYARETDWRQEQHWNCNNNVHPSRHGTYDEIIMHPYETLFVKSSWFVGEPFTSRYSKWFLEHAQGRANTAGQFDEAMYLYAISNEAILPQPAALDYYQVAS